MPTPDPQPLSFDDREAFHAWAKQQPRQHWERQDGLVIALAAERIVHARIKAQTWLALRNAIKAIDARCEALADGITVEVGLRTDDEPDVLVDCGERIANNELSAKNPVIVVEVLSPSTGLRDAGIKLDGYFSVPSVQHYLLISTDMQMVLHHSRLDPGRLLTRIHLNGTIDLDPPGLAIAVSDLYEGTEVPSR